MIYYILQSKTTELIWLPDKSKQVELSGWCRAHIFIYCEEIFNEAMTDMEQTISATAKN